MLNLKTLRIEYKLPSIQEKDLNANPFHQFQNWFEEAQKTSVLEPNAMVLATATVEGKPSSRTVLLKEMSENGFVFFTNKESRKAKEMSENPFVSATFLWLEIARQISIEGPIKAVTQEEASTYFALRPRGSQLGTWASHQSQVVTSREALEEAYEMAEKRFTDQIIPLPPYWGGFRIIPTRFEFWQGRENRLHDRFQYILKDQMWNIERLAP